jgi:D-xylulose reductase
MQPNETKPEYGRRVSDELKAKLDVPQMGPGAVDVLVEATGAEVCIIAGMHLLQGG